MQCVRTQELSLHPDHREGMWEGAACPRAGMEETAKVLMCLWHACRQGYSASHAPRCRVQQVSEPGHAVIKRKKAGEMAQAKALVQL